MPGISAMYTSLPAISLVHYSRVQLGLVHLYYGTIPEQCSSDDAEEKVVKMETSMTCFWPPMCFDTFLTCIYQGKKIRASTCVSTTIVSLWRAVCWQLNKFIMVILTLFPFLIHWKCHIWSAKLFCVVKSSYCEGNMLWRKKHVFF